MNSMINEIPKSQTTHGFQFSKFQTKIKIYLQQSNEIQLISPKKNQKFDEYTYFILQILG